MKKELLKSIVKQSGKEIIKSVVISLAVAGAMEIGSEIVKEVKRTRKLRNNSMRDELNAVEYKYNKYRSLLEQKNAEAKEVSEQLEYSIKQTNYILSNSVSITSYRCIRSIKSKTGFIYKKDYYYKFIKEGNSYYEVIGNDKILIFTDMQDSLFNKYFIRK